VSKIPVQCPSCGKRYGAPASRSGEHLDCPNCHTAIPIPSAGHSTQAPRREASPLQPVASRKKSLLQDPRLLWIGGAVAGGVVLLIATMIVINSLGRAGEPAQSTMPVARELQEYPVDPYYQQNGWVRFEDRKKRFAIWLPEAPHDVAYEPWPDRNMDTVNMDVGSSGNIFFMQDLSSRGKNVRKSIIKDRELLISYNKYPRTVLMENWGELHGATYLETLWRIDQNGPRAFQYQRTYAGKDWQITFDWLVPNEQPEEEFLQRFAAGFEPPAGG
jgi:hypothetical protein